MRKSTVLFLAVLLWGAAAATASAQNLGTFSWQLKPYGSVVTMTIIQEGAMYRVTGFEAQCGGNPSLPLTGSIVPQGNGQLLLGFTTITINGHGLHTRATINPASNFDGSYSDNAGDTGQTLTFRGGNQAPVCPGGPRTEPPSPGVPNPGAALPPGPQQ